MAEKISFEQFKNMVDNGIATEEILSFYLEQDPNARVPKLRFKTDALIDKAPDNYNVDEEIYSMIRRNEIEQNEEKKKTLRAIKPFHVVAEGDSWFRHCFLLGYPKAIGYWVGENKSISMNNIAVWGDTLSNIRYRKQYMKEITDYTNCFMLSGGGNDLQDHIENYIHDYDPKLSVDNYITNEGEEALQKIKDGYIEILSEVTTKFNFITILCYGYDHPRPHNGSRFIGQYLQKKHIPENMMKPIIAHLIDRLNDVIKSVVNSFSKNNVIFIDCRNATAKFPTWFDDMHPTSEGFKLLAGKFENIILQHKP